MQGQSNPNDDDSAPQNSSGFILDRRKDSYSESAYNSQTSQTIGLEDGGTNKDKKSQTYSLKRFVKYIASNLKANIKSGKPYCLSRLTILELKMLTEVHGISLAKSFDQFVKDIVLELLRKSDRIYANDLCDYVILMPNTNEQQGKLALERIIGNLAESAFTQSNLSIRPSSVYTLLDSPNRESKSITDLLVELEVDISEIESKDSVSSYKSVYRKDKGVSFSIGSESEWLKRYSLVEDIDSSALNRDFSIDGETVVKLRLGSDSWANDRSVLLKQFLLGQNARNSLESNKKAIVSCMRQLQSLKNTTISSLNDFHLDDNSLYVVDQLPNSPYVVTRTSKCSVAVNAQDKSAGCKKLILRKILLKLAGAFSSLQSLVPPVVPNDYSHLYLLFDGESENGDVYSRMTVLNYEISHLKDFFGDCQDSRESNDSLERFIDYVLELNQNCINSDDGKLIESLEELSGGKLKLKYNSFSKLKSLFED